MDKIGITGGIGSGKSAISLFFHILGVPIYNSDDRAKELMNHTLREEIISLFGKEAYHEGSLNRRFIAGLAFHNPGLLTQLNNLVHPAVKEDFNAWCAEQKSPYILKESALLIETGACKELDELVVVLVAEEERLKRVLKRDSSRNESEVKAIMNKQCSDSERVEAADYLIYNDNSCLLIPELLKMHDKFVKR